MHLAKMAKIKVVPHGFICSRIMGGVIKRIGKQINDKFYK